MSKKSRKEKNLSVAAKKRRVHLADSENREVVAGSSGRGSAAQDGRRLFPRGRAGQDLSDGCLGGIRETARRMLEHVVTG